VKKQSLLFNIEVIGVQKKKNREVEPKTKSLLFNRATKQFGNFIN